MLASDRRDLVTTDLLSEWTDPDTAMEAVGTSLGLFCDRVANPRNLLATDSPLRNALYEVLMSLVAGGALETRRCSDGRFAFRWRDDIEAAQTAIVPPVVTPPVVSSALDTRPVADAPSAVDLDLTRADVAESEIPLPPSEDRASRWARVMMPTAPLVFPAVSCLLALLAFVLLDRSAAVLVTAELAALGVIGLIRRVPFSALWTIGIIFATLLVRFS